MRLPRPRRSPPARRAIWTTTTTSADRCCADLAVAHGSRPGHRPPPFGGGTTRSSRQAMVCYRCSVLTADEVVRQLTPHVSSDLRRRDHVGTPPRVHHRTTDMR